MSKPFAVFDIDGTVARTSLYLATVHAFMRRGIINKEDSAMINQSLQRWRARESDDAFELYGETCVNILNNALPSIKLTAYQDVIDEVMEKFGKNIYRYPRQLITELKSKGYMIFAVSGSEQAIVKRFCEQNNFDDYIGNNYRDDGQYFTGDVGTTFQDKAKYVQQLVNKHGCSISGSQAVGDTHGDIEMLSYVEQPIAFNPNKTLFEHAKLQGWKIVIERKNVIYELESSDGSFVLA